MRGATRPCENIKGEDIYKAPVKEYSEFKKEAFNN